MSVKSAPYYWLECDGCGVKSTAGSDHSAWADESSAIDMANDYEDWWVNNPAAPGHWCESCQALLVCPECAELRTEPGGRCSDWDCGWTPGGTS